MLPVGTRVVVLSAGHLPRLRRPGRVVGRIGVVIRHHGDDAVNVVAGIGRFERLLGFRAFADGDLAGAGFADLPRLPRRIRIAAYYTSDAEPEPSR